MLFGLFSLLHSGYTRYIFFEPSNLALGQTYSYNLGFRAGIGFSAIAVALLGRNSAGGMAVSALLFGFLEVSSRSLELIDIAPETYVIMQGSILLSSVVAYEVVRRFKLTLQSNELAKVVQA